MTTKTTTVYIAFDGTEFEDKTDCEEYEEEHLLGQLSSKCTFLDCGGKTVTAEQFFSKPTEVDGFFVPNVEQATIVHRILEESGLDSPWNGNSDFTPGYYWYNGDEYENVEDKLKYWQDIYKNFQEA